MTNQKLKMNHRGHREKSLFWLQAGLCAVLSLLIATSVFGEIRVVESGSSGQAIQDSINICNAYDTVMVQDGRYFVTINTATDKGYIGLIMRDSICLMSEHGASACTLDAADTSGTAFHVICCSFDDNSSREAVIQGLTLQGSKGSGVIRCSYSSPTIKQNIIQNKSGGGIYCYFSSPVIQQNIIQGNWANHGGGIYCSISSPFIKYNLICDNSSDYGGGIYCDYWSSPIIRGCVICGNQAWWESGAIRVGVYDKIFIDSCFITDNGARYFSETGLAYLPDDADTLKINHSHLYYNTFQPDAEIDNNTSITIPLENNFWWFKDTTTIQNLIEGPADIMPFKNDFIPGVPGEPTSIDSVRNYDNTYSTIIDSIGNDPDTLYLCIYGTDRLSSIWEAAIAIVKSSIYTGGIAVALIETDTNSGIYEGKAIVKTSTGTGNIRVDDIYQTIRVNSSGDTITITANMDSLKSFSIGYRATPGVEEAKSPEFRVQSLECYPNPFTTVVRVQCLGISEGQKVSLKIYDLSGRLVKSFPLTTNHLPLTTAVTWDASNYPSGIYFIKLKSGEYKIVKKILLIK
ncbi:T9SS type A sorting domain-containing protein [candidate division WOR-3 bacterium]|nr:T9SS type A sorting domain-containing protein [candidate division WOR-3 bacterium]